ncbi:hypothetical protein FrEUN1fDRAFT_1080 [Parafrankia sp. EUN1f]|nr:hypothetical protein FrEUN1fDRAFT_1080 [Parafrankia sp. EUN1f]
MPGSEILPGYPATRSRRISRPPATGRAMTARLPAGYRVPTVIDAFAITFRDRWPSAEAY